MTNPIMNQTVERLRAGEKADRYGNKVPDWGTAVSVNLTGCSLQPSDTTELINDRQTTVSGWRLYAPGDADIKAVDRIRYKGITYEVSAQPQKWPDPFVADSVDHTEVALKQIDPPIP